MNSNRLKILLGVAVVLAAVLAWNWLAGWGLVTVEVKDVALSKVIKSIERQGGVTIATRIDPTSAVRMDVYRVPVAEAVEALAATLDADWSVVYAAGPDKAETKRVAAALRDDSVRESGLKIFRAGGGFRGFGGDTTPDPRLVKWKVSPMEPGALQSYADQFAQKTGASVLVPEGWNPTLKMTPKDGEARRAFGQLVAAAGGSVSEVFYLSENAWRGGPPTAGNKDASADKTTPVAKSDGPGGPGNGDRGPGGGDRGNRPEPNREWMAERAEAQIALLPKEEQAGAREEYAQMREFFDAARKLPEEERRAKFEQFFDNPKVQARMDDRRSRREDRSSPEKKADRARKYVERKQAQKNS